jgi:hypothetical protein
MNEFSVIFGGVLTAIVGIGHCFFYRFFGWAEDFEKTRKFTARVIYTIHIFLIPVLLFFAYISLVHTNELIGGTLLGSSIAVFFSIFWLMRGLWQVIYFRPSQLEGFKKLIPLHYALIVLFFLLFASYAIPILSRLM